MARTFHHDMMAALDAETYSGRTTPDKTHYAMRRALRKANMRGSAIMNDKQLAMATLAELAEWK
jgi:hypothetical protein